MSYCPTPGVGLISKNEFLFKLVEENLTALGEFLRLASLGRYFGPGLLLNFGIILNTSRNSFFLLPFKNDAFLTL